MFVLNRKRLGDNTYVVHSHNQSITVHTVSAPAARQKGIEYYRPKKHERDEIKVELISED